jgi:lipopolysaccharide export system protein LptA
MMRRFLLGALVMALVAPGVAVAAESHSTSAPAQAKVAGDNGDQPIQIEAATLEVHDKIKQATFTGDVQVVQGDTTMKCQKLVVFYGADAVPGSGAAAAPKQPQAAPIPTSAQNISRIEAHGGVTVFNKDQNAIGDDGIYDLKTKTITLIGNVVVSQGNDVVHGERVVVDTVTGNARVESTNAGGAAPSRVRALIQPSKGDSAGPSNTMIFGRSRTN